MRNRHVIEAPVSRRAWAEGRSSSAVAERFAVSERGMGKHVGNIFSKLGLPPSGSGHRRVLAVLAFLEGRRRIARLEFSSRIMLMQSDPLRPPRTRE